MPKQYLGRRFPEGTVAVEVHEKGSIKDLDIRLDLCNHSPTGFEWGFSGSGPAQLALAILADYSRKMPEPWVYQAFKTKFIAGIKEDRWEITEDQITKFLMSVNQNGNLDAFLVE